MIDNEMFMLIFINSSKKYWNSKMLAEAEAGSAAEQPARNRQPVTNSQEFDNYSANKLETAYHVVGCY
ncbi:MAG: hypothetical protein K2Q22_04305 [Cytophagales bacterium]|nr:hypothetical protein [Cytophagales bacterium]